MAYFDQLEPQYSLGLDPLSELAVTPEAHEYYGFEPRMRSIPGRLEPTTQHNSRQPYIQVILASPTEVADTKIEERDLFYGTSEGMCRFVVAHPQASREYIAGGCAEYCDAIRGRNPDDSRINQQILEAMDPKLNAAMIDELQAGHVADIANMLPVVAMPQIVSMRERSFPRNERRCRLIDEGGVSMTVLRGDGIETFTTLPNVIAYGIKRSQLLGKHVMHTFCDPKYDYLLLSA